MIEQEIVDYLKENWDKGISFGFMPEEVQNWCKTHRSSLYIYSNYGGWGEVNNLVSKFENTDIVALHSTYDLLEDPKGHWAEFNIDKKGYFQLYTDHHHFLWCRWSDFLDAYRDDERGEFITFGGWYYEGKGWSMFPLVDLGLDNGKTIPVERYASGEKAEPLVPSKIRFWRARI